MSSTSPIINTVDYNGKAEDEKFRYIPGSPGYYRLMTNGKASSQEEIDQQFYEKLGVKTQAEMNVKMDQRYAALRARKLPHDQHIEALRTINRQDLADAGMSWRLPHEQ